MLKNRYKQITISEHISLYDKILAHITANIKRIMKKMDEVPLALSSKGSAILML